MSRFLCPALFSVAFMAGCASPGEEVSKETTATPAAASRMTVGDLMSKGGKRLNATEMKELNIDATVTGSNQYGNWTRKQSADGKFYGQNSRFMGGSVSLHGDWRIDEEGRNCTLFRSQRDAKENCSFYYSLNGKHYTASGENPADSAVLENRVISR